MRALLIAALAALALAGCDLRKTPEASTRAGVDYEVDRLFTHEGCTVYRFRDSGRRYFTRCDGAASSSTSWSESCGKTCTRHMEVPTGDGGRQP